MINVGIFSADKEGKPVLKMGDKEALKKVSKDEGAAEVRKAAVKKHTHAEENYILLHRFSL